MKNKGFTLIELLSVIIILAILSTLIIPRVLTTVTESEKSANLTSARNIVQAAEYRATQNDTNGTNQEIIINYTDGTNTDYLDYKGKKPVSGAIKILEDGKIAMAVRFKDSCYLKTFYSDDVTVEPFDEDACNENSDAFIISSDIVIEFPRVRDNNPGIICGNGTIEDYDTVDTCYIYSVEDLVAFSSMVNSGKNFQGKTVMLMNGLDIENNKSYANSKSNQFGDINEDNTTSATLKEELTTEKGFKPIGDNTNTFAGTFEGNAHTIKNLFIDRSSTDYVGLFGYNVGTIRGLKIINANITGKSNIGIIAGFNNGDITSMIVDGDISGYSIIGLAVGCQSSGTGETEAITSGNITSTYIDVGGIVGYQSAYRGTTKGIYKTGSITTGNSTNVNRTLGYSNGTGSTVKTGALSTITVNENTVTSSNINSNSGYDIPVNAINNIAITDTILDTYIGGDNNNDGYYYDYDNNGEFTIYKLSDRPLNITMTGSGTEQSPYIINNYNDLKQVSYNLGTNGSGIYYKLNADIDLTNENPIMLASGDDSDETKRFTGVFDGNTHTISNLTLWGHNYTGLFGYNTGTIRGLKITDANITAYSNIGIIAGYNSGSITSMIVDGNISGYSMIGLAVGCQSSGPGVTEAITSGNITSTYIGVGGIIGYQSSYRGTTNGIYKSGNITTGNSTKVNRTLGYSNGSGSTVITGALSTITVNGETATSVSVNSTYAGYDIPANAINNIAITDTILDTYIGGDNNNDGYYYDYDNNGEFTIYKLSERPLEITMTGSGTEQLPYIINNYNDLKQVAYKLGTEGTEKYYRLNADIDLTNQNSIMLARGDDGDETKRFTGTFDGNAHTISNLTLYGHSYTGLFGYNTGIIKGLKVDNADISGYQYVGIIAGYNSGSITSMIADGDISGFSRLGLAVGGQEHSSGIVEIVVSGNLTGSSSDIANAGGITGYQAVYKGTTRGIYLSGSVNTVGTSKGNRTIGYSNGTGSTVSTGALSTITVRENTVTSTSLTSVNGKDYTAEQLQTLTPYQEVGLNTSSETGEYRYALDSNYHPYLIKN